MLESMTGTARGNFKVGGISFVFVLKSINHKFLDIHLKYPPWLTPLHQDLLLRANHHVRRGRLDAEIICSERPVKPGVNREVLEDYIKLTRGISGGRQGPLEPRLVVELMSLPGVIQIQETYPPAFPVKEVEARFDAVLEKLIDSRRKEGKKIGRLLKGCLKKVDQKCKVITKRLKSFQKEQLTRLRKDLLPLLDKELQKMEKAEGTDKRRLDGLAVQIGDWYNRFNINEELDRLTLHIEAMLDILETGEDAGKRIEFFTQELLREANTISSKSNDFFIRSQVVEIKTEIENIKEQARNLC